MWLKAGSTEGGRPPHDGGGAHSSRPGSPGASGVLPRPLYIGRPRRWGPGPARFLSITGTGAGLRVFYTRAFWSFLPCFCIVSTSEKNNMRTSWCRLVCVSRACCGQRTLVRDPGSSCQGGASWSSGPRPGEDAHLLPQKP